MNVLGLNLPRVYTMYLQSEDQTVGATRSAFKSSFFNPTTVYSTLVLLALVPFLDVARPCVYQALAKIGTHTKSRFDGFIEESEKYNTH